MPHADVIRAQDWLRAHEADLLSDYQALLRIPSVEADPEPGAPFGQANRDALELCLQLGESWGMRTKNLDGYIGYAEYGEGPLVMALGHVDVVPVGTGWKHEPFGAEIDGDYVYARGAVDDKGPTIAVFYAARALREAGVALPARIRVAFGCNEESGFRCIEHYVKHDETPAYGIAPDSGWPLYHAEKGIANLLVDVDPPTGELTILDVHGGERPNIVMQACSVRVRVAPSLRAVVEAKLADAWDRNVTATWEGDQLVVEAAGKPAHGSTPFLGDSAATRAFRFLYELAPPDQEMAFENLLMTTHPSGAGLGILGADEPSGDLTANVGIAQMHEGRIRLTVNVRYPVTWTIEDLRSKVGAYFAERPGLHLAEFTDSRPLYFPLEHPMVAAIVEAYEEETGERRKPGVMGGGTYARAIPNTVSIGTGWEGDGKAHEADERLKVDHLHKMARIYVNILYRLAHLAGRQTDSANMP